MKDFNLTKNKNGKSKKAPLFKFIFILTPAIIFSVLILNYINTNNTLFNVISIFTEIIIISLIILFFTDKDCYLYENLYDDNDVDDNGYYKAYLDIVIDSLAIANTHIENVKILLDYKGSDLSPYLKKIEGVFIHLNRVNPPKKYREYHEDILYELECFLKTHKK